MLIRPARGLYYGYLSHYLQGDTFKHLVKDRISGSSIPHIFQRDMVQLDIPVPSLSEQQCIAETLDAADATIQSTERLIAKLEQAKQGLLHDLLTRQSWPILAVREISLRVTDGDHHTPIKSTLGIPLIGAGNVQDGYLDLSSQEFVDEAEYARMIARCHPEAGDILISCSGSIGRVAQVPPKLRVALVRSVALVKPDTEKCLPGFLELALQSSFVQRQIKNAQKQLAQANLFQGAISELQLPLPEVNQQLAIIERVTSYKATITTTARELSKLRHLKHGLMDDLLTGRVRVDVPA
jgi:type I restriction enzyme, S subunit